MNSTKLVGKRRAKVLKKLLLPQKAKPKVLYFDIETGGLPYKDYIHTTLMYYDDNGKFQITEI